MRTVINWFEIGREIPRSQFLLSLFTVVYKATETQWPKLLTC